MEVGEDGDGDDAGNAVRGEPRRPAGAAERAVDRLGQDVLAIHAEAKTGERDAELRRRDVAILELRIAEDPLNTLARRSPFAARASMAARGAPTIANSAATKTAFSRMSTVMIANSIIAPPRGCRVAGAAAPS